MKTNGLKCPNCGASEDRIQMQFPAWFRVDLAHEQDGTAFASIGEMIEVDAEADGHYFCEACEEHTDGPLLQREESEAVAPAVAELVEGLDNVAAALETVLAHFEGEMYPHDSAQRRFLCNEARALVEKYGKGE